MTARWQTGTVACGGGEDDLLRGRGDDDPPAILFTHGAGGSHAAWFQQVPVFTAAGLPHDHVGLPRLRPLLVRLRRPR